MKPYVKRLQRNDRIRDKSIKLRSVIDFLRDTVVDPFNCNQNIVRKTFYTVFISIVENVLGKINFQQHGMMITVQSFMDMAIETERLMFNQSRILNILVQFLVKYSESDNTLQSAVYVKLLDWLLTKYNL
ncbi:ORF117 [Helicoverpa SNPV AC53]|uniref:ORF117 n=1 Tax=Helicoverpa SNPV AC53 TaxID=1569367 RepID=A0A075TZ89_9ABAC|nr:ORF117 [Helicoverpa SNPV AC53]AMN15311.1 ORF117 [Helicoverpa SNPV AC53]AMN15449.1 ORF117 [Helicoverpa SNPV AC53]AMN15587.1 ORF117 [Helicoverpa SNPV AC53]AMN15725.1 ORF117 [Helicoverpa SNPV AC53]